MRLVSAVTRACIPAWCAGQQVLERLYVDRTVEQPGASHRRPRASREVGVPAALRWSELHTGTQSVHVLPPPPRRPGRVRTVARAKSVPLPCAVTSQQGHDTHLGAGAAALRDRARPPYGVSDHARREARVINRRTARLSPDVRAMAASAASGGRAWRRSRRAAAAHRDRRAGSRSAAPAPAGSEAPPPGPSTPSTSIEPRRGCNRKQHGQRWPSPILQAPRLQAPRSPPRRRAGRTRRRQGAQELARTWSLVISPSTPSSTDATCSRIAPRIAAPSPSSMRRRGSRRRAPGSMRPRAPPGARDPRPRREGRPGAPRGA